MLSTTNVLPLRPDRPLPAEWDYSKQLERAILANGETPSERIARLAQEEELRRQLEAWRLKVLAVADEMDMMIPEVAALMPFTPPATKALNQYRLG